MKVLVKILSTICVLGFCAFFFFQAVKSTYALDVYNSAADDINSAHFQSAYLKLKKVISLDPQNSLVPEAMARTLVGLNQPKEALIELRKCSSNASVNINHIYYDAFLEEGDIDSAAKYMRKFAAVQSDGFTTESARAFNEQVKIYDRLKGKPGALSNTVYVAFATDETGIARWTVQSMPLAVFVESDKVLAARLPELRKLFLKGCKSWEKETNKLVSFKEVGKRKPAKIVCNFISDPGKIKDQIEQGQAVQSDDSAAGITGSQITILTVQRGSGQNLGNSDLYETVLHEVGHAIGIGAHSPSAQDVMFFSLIKRDLDRKVELSARDLQTLKIIYQSEKPCMPPKNSKLEKAMERIDGYNEHIKTYNAAVKAFHNRDFEKALQLAQEFQSLEKNNKFGLRLIKNCQLQLKRAEPAGAVSVH